LPRNGVETPTSKNGTTVKFKILLATLAFCLCSCQELILELLGKEEQLTVSKIYSIGSVGSHLTPQAGNTYHPENMIDGDTATTWALPFNDSGSIILDFHVSAEKVGHIELFNGYGKSELRHEQNSRAKEVSIYSNRMTTSNIIWKGFLKDTLGFQKIDLKTRQEKTSHIYIKINSVYPGNKWNDLCISEIKFFGTKDSTNKATNEPGKVDTPKVESTKPEPTAEQAAPQEPNQSVSTDTSKTDNATIDSSSVQEAPATQDTLAEQDDETLPEIIGESDSWRNNTTKIHLNESQIETMSKQRYVVLTESQKKELSDYWTYDTLFAISENWNDCTCMMIYCYWIARDTISVEKGLIPTSASVASESNDDDVDLTMGDFFGSLDYVIVGLDGNLYRKGVPVSIEELRAEQAAKGINVETTMSPDSIKGYGCHENKLDINIPSMLVMPKRTSKTIIRNLISSGLKFCISG
jgi:hypothetical protein